MKTFKIIFIYSILIILSCYVNNKPTRLVNTIDDSIKYSQQSENKKNVVVTEKHLKYEAQHYKKELSRAKSILEKSNQLLIVTSKDWDSTTASLTCYERR